MLKAMITRHLPSFDRFACLTDIRFTIPGIEIIPLIHSWPGWWSKCEAFSDKTAPKGTRILYFDLDVIIVGDLSDIASRTERLIVKGDTYRRPPRHHRISYQSSIMAWTAGEFAKVYLGFAKAPQYTMARFRNIGDQGWLEQSAPGAIFWEHILPKQIVSFKVDCRKGLPAGARVVDFHGKQMKPWNCKQSWACQALAIS